MFSRSILRKVLIVKEKLYTIGPAQDGREGNWCILKVYWMVRKVVIKKQDGGEKDCELERQKLEDKSERLARIDGH